MNRLDSRFAILLIAFGTAGCLTTAFLLNTCGRAKDSPVAAHRVQSLVELYLNTLKKSVTGTRDVNIMFAEKDVMTHAELGAECVIGKQALKVLRSDTSLELQGICRHSLGNSRLCPQRRAYCRSHTKTLQFKGARVYVCWHSCMQCGFWLSARFHATSTCQQTCYTCMRV